jgi:phosphatidylglycerophosphate synthase
LSATDKIDGAWARRIGATEHGRDLDRAGDRGFVMPQQMALTLNGEVPPVHFQLKRFREGGMQALRWWGARHGKDLTSRPVNKQKTAVEMTTMTAAHSPLAEHPDLVRWGTSMGTALSLTGLLETAFDYMRKDESELTDTARNSPVRQVSAGPLGQFAGFIDRKLPGITPSDVTLWGKRLVEGAAALAIARPDHPVVPTAIYTVGSLFDAFDGSLARAKGVDGKEGMIEDVQADLEQQIATLAALSVVARRRGNRVAATNYAIATMMMPLSAYTRAQAESRGYIVAEGGMGTRVGRGILGGVGMALNRYQDASDIVSAMLASGTVNTVHERRGVARYGLESEHCRGMNKDPEFMVDAKERQQAIERYAFLGLAVGTALLTESNFQGARRLASREGSKSAADEVVLEGQNTA